MSWWESEASAAFVAAVLTDGFNPALAGELSDRVTEYLGREQKRRLHKRDQASVDCTLLAEAARAILALKQKTHQAVGEAAGQLLDRVVRDLPRFHRLLVKKVVEKLPLPWDAKLAAIARGLQVIGIWICLVGDRLEQCECLRMLGIAVVKEQAEQAVKELLDATERDLQDAARRLAGTSVSR